MKRLISAMLALCLLLSMSVAAFAAQERVVPVCGNKEHYKGDGLDHSRPQSCWVTGHFSCDGQDHSKAECGWWSHYNCDPKPHNPASCGAEGHYVCDGRKHGPAPCGLEGHCIGDDKYHTAARCGLEGHFNCLPGGAGHKLINQFCKNEPKHHTCQTDTSHYCDPELGGCGVTYDCTKSGSHTPCLVCGRLWCDDSLGGHYTPCGKMAHRPCAYALNGNDRIQFWWRDHDECKYCGMFSCDNGGKHGEGKCVVKCDLCGVNAPITAPHQYECGDHYSCQKDEREDECCAECRLLACTRETSGGHVHCEECSEDCICMVGDLIHRWCVECAMDMCSEKHDTQCKEFKTLLRLVQQGKL